MEEDEPDKLVFVNNDDFDDDGVPDYADGIDIYDASGLLSRRLRQQFVRASHLSARSGSAEHDDRQLFVRCSNPACITRTGDEINGNEYTLPGWGRCDLDEEWLGEAIQSRRRRGRGLCGDGHELHAVQLRSGGFDLSVHLTDPRETE